MNYTDSIENAKIVLLHQQFDYLLFMECGRYLGYTPYDLIIHALAAIDPDFKVRFDMGGLEWIHATYTNDELARLFLNARGHDHYKTHSDWIQVAKEMHLQGWPH